MAICPVTPNVVAKINFSLFRNNIIFRVNDVRNGKSSVSIDCTQKKKQTFALVKKCLYLRYIIVLMQHFSIWCVVNEIHR